MKNFKDILFGIIILLIVILLGYWAVVSIESGSTHVEKQKQQELEQKNKELEQKIETVYLTQLRLCTDSGKFQSERKIYSVGSE